MKYIFIAMIASALTLTAKEKVIHYTTANGLVSDSLSFGVLNDSKGNIWVSYNESSTDQGIGYFDGAQWHQMTTDDGLKSNYIYDIHEDPAGNLWVEYKNSIGMYDGST